MTFTLINFQMIREKKLERRRRRKKEVVEIKNLDEPTQHEDTPRPPAEDVGNGSDEEEKRPTEHPETRNPEATDRRRQRRRRRRRPAAESDRRSDSAPEETGAKETRSDSPLPPAAEPRPSDSPSRSSPLTLTPHPVVMPHTIVVRPTGRNPMGLRTPKPPDGQFRVARKNSGVQRGSFRCEFTNPLMK